MVGLPARGKTYIGKKLTRYLNWIGVNTKGCFFIYKQLYVCFCLLVNLKQGLVGPKSVYFTYIKVINIYYYFFRKKLGVRLSFKDITNI